MSEWIDTNAALNSFCQRASSASTVALDTEFLRERTYYPELCLIQAGLPDEIVLIDALADLDWAPLQALLSGQPEKILHACRQDQEVLLSALNVSPLPLFDTQLAAALCGYAPQASYASLVADICDVALVKGSQRTDWSRRPLSAAQLEYAADDVRYLAALRETLLDRLSAQGRMQWFSEDMRALAQPPLDPDPLQVWSRVKGAGNLDARQLAVLRQLAAWRERRAVARNRPRRWILADEILLNIAQREAQTREQFAALGVSEKLLQHQLEALLEAVQTGLQDEPLDIETRIPDKAQIKQLQKALKARAQELQLEPSLLATRSDLSALVLTRSAEKLESGWRAQQVLPQLKAAL